MTRDISEIDAELRSLNVCIIFVAGFAVGVAAMVAVVWLS